VCVKCGSDTAGGLLHQDVISAQQSLNSTKGLGLYPCAHEESPDWMTWPTARLRAMPTCFYAGHAMAHTLHIERIPDYKCPAAYRFLVPLVNTARNRTSHAHRSPQKAPLKQPPHAKPRPNAHGFCRAVRRRRRWGGGALWTRGTEPHQSRRPSS